MNLESDSNCTNHNSNIQAATAEVGISAGCTTQLRVNWCGRVEQHNTGFEQMRLYVDGVVAGYAESTAGQQDCAPMSPINGVQAITLQPGAHWLRIKADTIDAAYHIGAHYEFMINLQPE